MRYVQKGHNFCFENILFNIITTLFKIVPFTVILSAGNLSPTFLSILEYPGVHFREWRRAVTLYFLNLIVFMVS